VCVCVCVCETVQLLMPFLCTRLAIFCGGAFWGLCVCVCVCVLPLLILGVLCVLYLYLVGLFQFHISNLLI